MSASLAEGVCNFLVRLVLVACEVRETTLLTRRGVRLLREALTLWRSGGGSGGSGLVKFNYIERFFERPVCDDWNEIQTWGCLAAGILILGGW